MDKNQELKNFNLVKIILMLAIVFYHSMLMFAGADWGPDKTVCNRRSIIETESN